MKPPSLHFLSTGRLDPNPAWGLAAHAHTFHELIVLLNGRMEVKINGRVLHARAGEALFYPKGHLHAERSDRDFPVESLFMAFEGGATDLSLQVHDAEGRLRVLAQWLYAERDSYAPNAGALRQALLRTILAEYVRLSSAYRHPLVEEIRGYVRAHLAEEIALEQLAARAGLTKFHFLRRYRALTGKTPMADVRAIRLDFARNLILSSGLPLKSIAVQSGLGDAYQLSRLFRKYLRAAPSALRGR